MRSSPSKRSVKRAQAASQLSRRAEAIWQVKISLRGAKPPIWRRVIVPASMTLTDLHHVIQTAMGWTDTHLHEFEIGGVRYAAPNPFYDELDSEVLDAGSVRLADVTDVGATMTYTYDFGDDWRHDVLVEKEVETDAEIALPICVAGRRGCPPEDVGGVWGYEGFLEAWQDPSHPEHAELREWAGPYFDPVTFDAAEVNVRLRALT